MGGQTRAFRTKTGAPMGVPLTPLIRTQLGKLQDQAPEEVRFLLASRYNDRAWPLNRYHQNVLDAVREKAGLTRDDWWPHRCRRVASTLLDRAGVPLDNYRRALSHARERNTTMEFSRFSFSSVESISSSSASRFSALGSFSAARPDLARSPHVHALASPGGWDREGTLAPRTYIDEKAAHMLFRQKVLALQVLGASRTTTASRHRPRTQAARATDSTGPPE